MSIDLTPIVQPIIAVVGTVIAGFLAVYVPRAIAAFETRTGIMLTDQQRAIVAGAIKTAAGVIETDLDKGAMSISHVNVNSAAIQDQANAAIAAVPKAAAALGVTPDSVARMIVGAVNTSAHGVAPVQVVAAVAAPVPEVKVIMP